MGVKLTVYGDNTKTEWNADRNIYSPKIFKSFVSGITTFNVPVRRTGTEGI